MQDDRPLYENLAAHLDRLPAGFPRTPSGVEIRILRRLFSQEEAALAPLLDMKPELPEEIAGRAGLAVEELAPRLETMSRRGLIYRVRLAGRDRYMAAQFLIGIWEFHVNDLDPDLIRDMN
ncbi:MAG: 4Fe-4S ferredoxin, partial [Desulfobacteraceae bacterium]|nr:4Fe-4S ferredoxin [Desulfobacteraceae bacterium]